MEINCYTMEIVANKYILLKNLEVYKLARMLSEIGWEAYNSLDWQTKKTIGDQFIESTDSAGANIAEGYGRFHYLDKIKFYYNARGSLMECSEHWVELLYERKKITKVLYLSFKNTAKELLIKLNNFISAIYNSKKEQ